MGRLMLNYNILNSKETKHILTMLKEQYGYDINKNNLDYIFLMNKDNRIYVVSKNLGDIDFEKLRLDMIGIYFGEVYKKELRLSIEGAQIIGKDATKNIIELDHNQMIKWIMGEDIEFENCGKDFVIVRYKEIKTEKYDILGCGKYHSASGKLINYVSKSRKLIVVNN